MMMTFSKYLINAISLVVYLTSQKSGHYTLAFTTSSFTSSRNNHHQSKSRNIIQLNNVPPPGLDADPQIIKEAADRESPPQSFFQLQINCARASEIAIRDGHKLIEIEV